MKNDAKETLNEIGRDAADLESSGWRSRQRARFRTALNDPLGTLASCLGYENIEAQGNGDARGNGSEIVENDESRGCFRAILAKDKEAAESALRKSSTDLTNAEANLTDARNKADQAEATEQRGEILVGAARSKLDSAGQVVQARESALKDAIALFRTTRGSLDRITGALETADRQSHEAEAKANENILKKNSVSAKAAGLRSQIANLDDETKNISKALEEDLGFDDASAFQRLATLSRASSHKRLVELLEDLKTIEARNEQEGGLGRSVSEALAAAEEKLFKERDRFRIQVVGISDPNDPLSYGIPLELRRKPSDVDFVDVEIHLTPSYLGLYANPIAAHEGHIKSRDVTELMVCGTTRTNDKQEKYGIRHCAFP